MQYSNINFYSYSIRYIYIHYCFNIAINQTFPTFLRHLPELRRWAGPLGTAADPESRSGTWDEI